MYFNCTDLENCKFYLNSAKPQTIKASKGERGEQVLGLWTVGGVPGSGGFCSRKMVLHLQAGKEGSILAVVYSTLS